VETGAPTLAAGEYLLPLRRAGSLAGLAHQLETPGPIMIKTAIAFAIGFAAATLAAFLNPFFPLIVFCSIFGGRCW
jgi:hypothetical protein